MSLKKQLMDDMKTAMKEKDRLRKTTIIMLRADIKRFEVDERKELSDDGIIDIISKQIKQKKSAVLDFRRGDREDLVQEAEAEIEILMKYLPEQFTEEELKEIISSAISELKADSMKDMGKVMGAVKPIIKGKADGKMASDIVKAILS
ncbi:MAG: GatB/YqeY domain-containing protein [Peptostreptococcaceae bacterium]|nr:GatB/YqeY domain-containing protein [Peptostreptococcaceae bacterium]